MSTKAQRTPIFQISILALAVLALASLTGCGSGRQANRVDPDGSLHGRISLSGAFAVYPLAVRWSEEFRRVNPDVRIEIDAGGAGKGITDALTGQVELGMVSRELNEAEIARGAVAIAVARDAVVPTVSAANPFLSQIMERGLSAETAKRIWVSGEIRSWGAFLGPDAPADAHVTRLDLFSRSDACGAAETWACWLGVHQEDLRGEGLNGDPSMASAVGKDSKAIGFNNIGYAFDSETLAPIEGIRILPIDINGNGHIDPDEDFYHSRDALAAAIADGRYPAPPARNLYLVSRGEVSDPVVRAFLSFILSPAGQRINAEAGYIPVNS